MDTTSGFYPVLHTLRSWPSELGDPAFLTALGLKNYAVAATGQGYQVRGVLKYLGGPVFEVNLFNFARLVPGQASDSFEADFTCYFDDTSFELTVPALDVTLFLKPGLLLPVRRQGAQWVDVLTPAGAPAEPAITIQAARVSYGLGSGLGLQVDPRVTLALSPVRIKGTSIVVEVTGVTPYLLANNDPAAVVPLGFRGVAVDQATVHFPNIFTPDVAGSTAALVGSQVRLGTGGVSGQFALVADDPAKAPVLKFTVLNKLDVQITSAGLALNDNSFISSHLAGTIQLPNPQSATAPKLTYDLTGSLDGEDFQLAAVARAPVPTLDFGRLGTLDLYRAEVGKQAGKWTVGGAFTYHLDQTIPFLQKALPRTVNVYNARLSEDNALTELGASFEWANGQRAGGSLDSPGGLFLPINIDTGIASISAIRLKKSSDAAGHAAYDVRFNLALQLAPGQPQAASSTAPDAPGLVVRALNTGLRVGAAFPSGGGNVGPAEVALDVLLPTGLAASINLGGVVGAGSLAILEEGHRYEGSLILSIQDKVTVRAFGILTDHLPDGTPATSFLALLTATFTPIQLGLGFTLNGLGGLVGINRQADVEFLRGLVRQNQLKKLLFDDAVATDPSAALALLDAAFPVARGRHTIGLMAQLGWGAQSSLITLDAALLVEFPAPLTVLLLGSLRASLPSAKNELLKLRADFLGYVDFGARKASFDASLVDSKLLMFSLSGDLAFRLYQGQNPVFVITAGGFHPSFQPPAGANLTDLKRITLAYSRGDELRLNLASYFAVTSNTVQFGAHLDLYYRICRGLHVEGLFHFDTLFQFDPFRVLAHVEAGVAIKNGGSELLSLHLSLDVAGPRPWHIWGEASFRIWFVKISVGVNASFGDSGREDTLPAPNVHQLLTQALAEPTSWEVEVPATPARPGGVVLRPVAATAGQPFLDPRGALALRQHVAPLGVRLDKYGNSTVAPTGGRYFRLQSLTLGNHTYALTDPTPQVEETRENFAPDQFMALSEGQRLSLPSFQLLPNGLRLKSLAGLTSTPALTRRVVRYEQKKLDGTSAGRRPMLAGQFRQLTRGSALGQAVQAAQPSARAPQPVGWAEATYSVVNAADLSPYQNHPDFATQAEAAQYCQAVVAAHPALAAELLVIASYERALA